MAFPYVERSMLERRLQVDAMALQVSDQEWGELIAEVLQSASERVEGAEYADHNWRHADSLGDVPNVVQEAVIRLCRARIHEVRNDGLESENTGDNASYNYRPPADIRAEVRTELQAADFGDDAGDSDVNATMI